jgi:hypothetical protein
VRIVVVCLAAAALLTACGGTRDLSNTELAEEIATAFGGGVWECSSTRGYSAAYNRAFNRRCDPSAGVDFPFYVNGNKWCSVYRLSASVPMCPLQV